MEACRTLLLYGAPAARENARLLLENLPQVRRVDAIGAGVALRLFFSEPVSENEMIPLLAKSGISGFGFLPS